MLQVEASTVWIRAWLANARRWLRIFGIELWGCTKAWRYQVGTILLLTAACWAFINVATAYGDKPRPSWMIFAGVSCVIAGSMAIRRFKDLTLKSGLEIDPSGARGEIAFLLAQYLIIIVGNTAEVVQLLWRGLEWLTADNWNAAFAAVGMLPLVITAVILRIKRQWRLLAWARPHLEKLKWDAPWARCWYVINLKAIQQVVALGSAVIAVIHPTPWFVAFVGSLVILASYRLRNARRDRKVHPDDTMANALYWGARIDRATLVLYFVAIVMLAVPFLARVFTSLRDLL